MAFSLDKHLYIPGEDFQYDRDLHIKNWRALRVYLESANDVLPMIEKDALPLTSDWPKGTMIFHADEMWVNTSTGWKALAYKP